MSVKSDYLGITEENFFICAGENFRKLLDGKINSNEFWVRFSLRYGKKVKEELFGKFFNPGINQDTKDIIKQLKNNSRVVCGTNTIDSHYYYLLNQGDYDIFDAVYASNLIGLSKPDPDFYWHILRSEDVKPEEAVFIDDTEENVLSAQEIGINSILFTDSDSLKTRLNNLIIIHKIKKNKCRGSIPVCVRTCLRAYTHRQARTGRHRTRRKPGRINPTPTT